MISKKWFALVLVVALWAGSSPAAEPIPMKQGLHQWPAKGGRLMLVVGTYQDSTSFRRSYSFYFKEEKDEAWYQVAVTRKNGERAFPWQGAVGGEVTLADGLVVVRDDGLYFVVGDKRASNGYGAKGDLTATWYKLTEANDDEPDEPPYRLAPVFVRNYPKSTLTVEAILAREAGLRPSK